MDHISDLKLRFINTKFYTNPFSSLLQNRWNMFLYQFRYDSKISLWPATLTRGAVRVNNALIEKIVCLLIWHLRKPLDLKYQQFWNNVLTAKLTNLRWIQSIIKQLFDTSYIQISFTVLQNPVFLFDLIDSTLLAKKAKNIIVYIWVLRATIKFSPHVKNESATN